jgi:AmiR/NasT family two-component response regulator
MDEDEIDFTKGPISSCLINNANRVSEPVNFLALLEEQEEEAAEVVDPENIFALVEEELVKEVVEAVRSGALGIVTKPIKREILISEVNRVLAR